MMTTTTDLPIACDRDAIPSTERARHGQLARRLFLEPRAIDLQRDGGDEGLRIALDAGAFDDLAEWLTLERLCCPFLRFGVDVSPAGGPVVLTLIGPVGTLAFLEAELGLIAQEN